MDKKGRSRRSDLSVFGRTCVTPAQAQAAIQVKSSSSLIGKCCVPIVMGKLFPKDVLIISSCPVCYCCCCCCISCCCLNASNEVLNQKVKYLVGKRSLLRNFLDFLHDVHGCSITWQLHIVGIENWSRSVGRISQKNFLHLKVSV